MSKIVKGLVIGAALAVATPAMAATISYPLFSNGDTTIDAMGNASVSGTFTLMVGAGEVCEVLRTQADGSQPFIDTVVGGPLGYQQGTYTNVPFTVKAPPNTGTYYPIVQCAGIWGGNHSVDGDDGVVVGPVGLGTLRVVANTTGGGSGGSGAFGFGSFADLIAALKEALGLGAAKPPTASPLCADLTTRMNAGMRGMTTDANAVLQGFLLGNGASIPALKAGAAFGYWGEQTQAAINWFKGMHGCV